MTWNNTWRRMGLVVVIGLGLAVGLPIWQQVGVERLSKRIRDYRLTYYRAPEHPMPPVNALDPYDMFQKDANGDLVIVASDKKITSPYAGAEFRGFWLKTKKGSPVLVYGGTPMRELRYKTNCHGLTFMGGEYWMMPKPVETILADAGWSMVAPEKAQSGDVAIYRDLRGEIVHSARVVGRDESGHVIVDSKNGYNPRTRVWAYQPVE
ncbi:MAG: hypothetical protein PCFJNLEI_01883 [Verrucomicrobiae bacterium]|nr:hypothetical protein [Verrucomicrobiae bacterium]